MNDDSLDEKRTAYHEAGHVVVGRHLGLSVIEVTIVPSPRFLGCTRFNEFTVSHPRVVAEKQSKQWIMVDYAGWLAEKLCDYDSNVEFSGSDKSDALAEARRLVVAGYLFYDERGISTILHQLATQTEQVILPRWEQVEVLAEELLRKRTLSGQEVSEILKLGRRALADQLLKLLAQLQLELHVGNPELPSYIKKVR